MLTEIAVVFLVCQKYRRQNECSGTLTYHLTESCQPVRVATLHDTRHGYCLKVSAIDTVQHDLNNLMTKGENVSLRSFVFVLYVCKDKAMEC